MLDRLYESEHVVVMTICHKIQYRRELSRWLGRPIQIDLRADIRRLDSRGCEILGDLTSEKGLGESRGCVLVNLYAVCK